MMGPGKVSQAHRTDSQSKCRDAGRSLQGQKGLSGRVSAEGLLEPSEGARRLI